MIYGAVMCPVVMCPVVMCPVIMCPVELSCGLSVPHDQYLINNSFSNCLNVLYPFFVHLIHQHLDTMIGW